MPTYRRRQPHSVPPEPVPAPAAALAHRPAGDARPRSTDTYRPSSPAAHPAKPACAGTRVPAQA